MITTEILNCYQSTFYLFMLPLRLRAEGATQWTESATSPLSDWLAEDDVDVREALISLGGPAG